jgi:hypothetical protein
MDRVEQGVWVSSDAFTNFYPKWGRLNTRVSSRQIGQPRLFFADLSRNSSSFERADFESDPKTERTAAPRRRVGRPRAALFERRRPGKAGLAALRLSGSPGGGARGSAR